MFFKPYIVLPLYLYPAPGAWKPLFEQVNKFPQVNFQVIINPNSGPQFFPPASYPESNWIDVISRLNSKPNVQTIGYVHTNWTDRPMSDVCRDIDAYADWADYRNADIHMDGIFFDEAPADNDPGQLAWMRAATKYARQSIRSPKMPNNGTNIMLNPGTIVAPGYYDFATSIVAFEDVQNIWKAKASNPMTKVQGPNKPKSAFMINSFSGTPAQQRTLVLNIVNNNITGVYISTRNDYDKWSNYWPQLVNAVAAACL